MAYKVMIGHLVCDEYGTSGSAKSKPGDQTGKESRIQEWYSTSWQFVFRPKTKKLANIIASAMETICNMPNLGGYNQTRRTTLANYAKAHNWKLEEVTEPCESDCSSAIAVCLNAAGIPVSIDMYTGNAKKIIEATGKFKTLTADKYLKKPDNLKRGDIILKIGHIVTVVDNVYVIDRELSEGSKGKDVKMLQTALNENGFTLEVDGILGTLTKNAVLLFQKDHKLKQDGIVGKKTAIALGFGWEGF